MRLGIRIIRWYTAIKRSANIGHFIGEDAVNMFSLNILSGDKNPLHDPHSIVLTEETAKALFGNENPLNKIVRLDNTVDLKVTAVVTKLPKNSSLSFDYLMPFQLQESIYSWIKQYHKTNWGNNSWQVFVQLNDHATEKSVNAKIKNVVISHFTDENTLKSIKPEVIIQPMSKWRLYSDFENGSKHRRVYQIRENVWHFGTCRVAHCLYQFHEPEYGPV